MRKVLIICLIFLCLFFGSCKNNYILFRECIEAITEIENFKYQYKSEDFYATFTGGLREEPYILDGIVNKNVEFGLIKIKFLEYQEIENISAILTINYNDYYLDLEQNPFDFSYMADLGISSQKDDTIFIKLFYNEVEIEFQLVDIISNLKITNYEALKIFVDKYEYFIEKFKVYEKLNIEFHICLLENSNITREKFWYVAFFDSDKCYCACIDTEKGEILLNNVIQ